MAKIVASDGTEFPSLKKATAYERAQGIIDGALSKIDDEDERSAVKKAILAGVVKVALPPVKRKPRTRKE